MTRPMRHSPPRRGYALVMTILLIAIATLLLAGIASQSFLLATETLQAQEDLQRRWGTITCQQAILARANLILAGANHDTANTTQPPNPQTQNPQTPPRGRLATQLPLGNLTFDVLLADEQAKVNLNTLYAWRGREEAERAVKAHARATARIDVRSRPYRTTADGRFPAFDSWGQVFAQDHWHRHGSIPAAIAEATTELTCWGDGKLHVGLASDEALKEIAQLAVNQRTVQQLLDARRANPAGTLTEILEPLRLRSNDRQRLEELLTDQSDCYSLWLTVANEKRQWRLLLVAQSLANQTPHIASFVW